MNITVGFDYNRFILILVSFLAILLTGCGSGSDTDTKSSANRVIEGSVVTGSTAIKNTTVKLYSTAKNSGKTSLATAKTKDDGSFTLHYGAPAAGDGILIITTSGGALSGTNTALPDQYSLATAIASSSVSSSRTTQLTINDRTTVATAFAMAQFVQDTGISGAEPGLSIAAGMIANLVVIGLLRYAAQPYNVRS